MARVERSTRSERWEVTTRSVEETRRLARPFGEAAPAGALLCLHGELGAGKTVFVQGLAEGLGFTDYVTSPSFVLIQQYPGRLMLHHADLYRLDTSAVRELGLEEILDAGEVVAVEWAERMPAELRVECLDVEIAFGAEPHQRRISISARGEAPAALLRRAKQSFTAHGATRTE